MHGLCSHCGSCSCISASLLSFQVLNPKAEKQAEDLYQESMLTVVEELIGCVVITLEQMFAGIGSG